MQFIYHRVLCQVKGGQRHVNVHTNNNKISFARQAKIQLTCSDSRKIAVSVPRVVV